jgi:hypothetical protein
VGARPVLSTRSKMILQASSNTETVAAKAVTLPPKNVLLS